MEKFPGVPVPHRNTVRNLVKVTETGSFHDRTRKGKYIILTEEKVVEIGESLKHFPCVTIVGNSKEQSLTKQLSHH